MNIAEKIGRFVPEGLKSTIYPDSLHQLVDIACQKGVKDYIAIYRAKPQPNWGNNSENTEVSTIIVFETPKGREVRFGLQHEIGPRQNFSLTPDSETGFTDSEYKAFLTDMELQQKLARHGIRSKIISGHKIVDDPEPHFELDIMDGVTKTEIAKRALQKGLQAYPLPHF